MQRDMERIDELNTKVRTTGYDNDRLRSMHQNAVEVAGNAEREMNLWKSRASCVSPSLFLPTPASVEPAPPNSPGPLRRWRKRRRRSSKL